LAANQSSGYNFVVPSVSARIRLKVLFFGRIRELCGLSEESIQMAEGATLEEVFTSYALRFPKLSGFHSSLVASRNQEFAAWDTKVTEGDEIAFLPPVSGG
jgi:molybdopterin converting factor subunit 1